MWVHVGADLTLLCAVGHRRRAQVCHLCRGGRGPAAEELSSPCTQQLSGGSRPFSWGALGSQGPSHGLGWSGW